MNIDVERARAETPGCMKVLHLNNAGASLPPAPVTDAVVAHLRREEMMGGYEAADAAAEQIENTYRAIGRLIGCQATEIAIVENATVAWDMAFYSFKFGAGDRILTDRAQYASSAIALLQMARRTGVKIEIIDNDDDGQVGIADLRRRVGPDVKLIALTHVPSQGGLVNPAEEVGAVAREHGIPMLLDACQSVGQMQVDVKRIGCDMLSATGRKFLRGPRGTGFLYVRDDLIEKLEPPFLDLHSATWTGPNEYEIRPGAGRFENWENYVAGQIGLGVAVDYALELGMDAIEDRVTMLGEDLRSRLDELPGADVHDQGRRRCGIVTFTVKGVRAQQVQAALAKDNINVSVSTVDYARLDLAERGLPDLVRASVHYYNTEQELDVFCSSLRKIQAL